MFSNAGPQNMFRNWTSKYCKARDGGDEIEISEVSRILIFYKGEGFKNYQQNKITVKVWLFYWGFNRESQIFHLLVVVRELLKFFRSKLIYLPSLTLSKLMTSP